MFRGLTVGAVVPARDEEANIGAVVGELLALGAGGECWIDDFVVCDNGSSDRTADRARAAGARVVRRDRPGYGGACLEALAALAPVEVVLFSDGDRSFHAAQCERLLAAVAAGADLAIGSRALGRAEAGALSPPQVAGNRIAARLIRWLWGAEVTDLGPYRAIRSDALDRIGMRDEAYGWTVEMQVRAIQCGLTVVQVPLNKRRRRAGERKSVV